MALRNLFTQKFYHQYYNLTNSISQTRRSISLSTYLNSNDMSTDFKNNGFKLGFVGTGRIAQAIILGLIKKDKIKAEQIYASDANEEYLNYLKDQCPKFNKLKINFLNDNSEVFKHTKTVMICVKPKEVPNLLKEVSSKVNKDHLILSIAAGIQLNQLEKSLPKEARVIRIMTNINALVQQSSSVFSKGTNATEEDANCVKKLLEAIGTCEEEIHEDLMDVVTALSGSGPAYMCLVLDALADGAVKMGMGRKLALRLAAQTMLGTANMIVGELNGGRHIMGVKEEVSSPGGTSIHGIAELEHYNTRYAFIKCIEAATNRAKEMNPKTKK